MTPIYIFLGILGLWLAYKAVILLWHGIKAASAQALFLEEAFGNNAWWAFRYTVGLSVEDQDHDAND